MRGTMVVALVAAWAFDCNCGKDIETYAGQEAFERECGRDEPDDGEVAMYNVGLTLCDGTRIGVSFREAGGSAAAGLIKPTAPPPPPCGWLLEARFKESLLIVAEGTTDETWRVTPMHQITWKPAGARKYQTTVRGEWCELPGEIL